MRLALLGPIAWRTPPRHYGPWELVTGLLADGLAQRGVDVTLFATLDSITLARLDGVCERPYEEDATIDGRVWEALHIAHALSRSADFDLIHNHLDWLPLALSALVRTPMVTTIHGFSSPRILPAYARSASAFVSISDADRVRYLGSVGREERADVLGAAGCLLHPIAFAEPFGLSVVEAMLCGTPVVAYDRGSMPEIVDDGVTGVLAHDVDSAVGAVRRATGLDRAACREAAERRFSADRMVDDYLEVYERLLGDR